MSPDKLAYMANQIGKFFTTQKNEDGVASVADHIVKFWDPRMRRDFMAHLDTMTLDPIVRQAAERLRARSSEVDFNLRRESPSQTNT